MTAEQVKTALEAIPNGGLLPDSSDSDSDESGDADSLPNKATLLKSGSRSGSHSGSESGSESRSESGSTAPATLTVVPPRHRVIKSVAVYATFFGNALVVGSIGPAMVSFQALLDTSLKMISLVFSVLALACLPGTIAMGIWYDRVNKEILFALACTLMGLSSAVAPFTGHILGFLACYGIFGLSVGIINTAALLYVVRLWDGHRWRNAHMHLPHLMISGGAAVGPFLLQPFLPKTPAPAPATTSQPGMDDYNNTVSWNVTSLPATEAPGLDASDVQMVRYAFILLSSAMAIPAALFVFTFLSDLRVARNSAAKTDEVIGSDATDVAHEGEKKKKKKKQKKEKEVITEKKSFRVVILVFLFLIFYCWLWMEMTTPYFLAPFVVRGLGWTNQQAALLTSIFWGSQGLGRAAGVPLSVRIPARFMVLGDVTLALCALVLLLFSSLHGAVVWVGAGLLGLAVATFFGSSMVLTSEHITLTQTVSSTIMLAFSASQMSAPFAVGVLMETKGYMTLIYGALAAAGMAALFLTLAKIFVVCKGKGQVKGQEAPLEPEVSLQEMAPLDGADPA